MIRLRALFVAVLIFLAASPIRSDAHKNGDYDVAAYDNTTLGTAANGSYGHNYVMSSPNIHEQHVSSIYVYDWNAPTENDLSMAEVGWVANVGQTNKKPRFFVSWMVDGNLNDALLNYPAPGTKHYYSTRWIPGGTQWVWRIDGEQVWTGGLGGFKSGYSIASSERDSNNETPEETNYSWFWNLQKWDSNPTGWQSWTNQTELSDTDPNYYISKVTEKEFYVQR